MTMKVRIKGSEYEFSFDGVWGPVYTYEVLVGNRIPFDASKTLCMHILYYCILLRANPGITLTLDDFFEALNDMEIVKEMNNYYAKRMQVLTSNDSKEETSSEEELDKKKD